MIISLVKNHHKFSIHQLGKGQWSPFQSSWGAVPSKYSLISNMGLKSLWSSKLTCMSDLYFIYILSNFYTRPVLAFGYCHPLRLCVCMCGSLCVNYLLVCALTQDPFKLGSPNLDQRCKTTWFKVTIVLWNDWPWPSRSNLTTVPHFEFVHTTTHHPEDAKYIG